VSSDILIDELFFEIDKWITEGMHRPKNSRWRSRRARDGEASLSGE